MTRDDALCLEPGQTVFVAESRPREVQVVEVDRWRVWVCDQGRVRRENVERLHLTHNKALCEYWEPSGRYSGT